MSYLGPRLLHRTVDRDKNAKIAEILSNFGKNGLYSIILVAKYKFHVKTLFFQEMQKCSKNSSKVTI